MHEKPHFAPAMPAGFRRALTTILIGGISVLAAPSISRAESFTCLNDTSAACLSRGESICTSQGRCVTSDAVCFESNTCAGGEFVCAADLRNHVSDFTAQITQLTEAEEKARNGHAAAVRDYNKVAESYSTVVRSYLEFQACVQSSPARNCQAMSLEEINALTRSLNETVAANETARVPMDDTSGERFHNPELDALIDGILR